MRERKNVIKVLFTIIITACLITACTSQMENKDVIASFGEIYNTRLKSMTELADDELVNEEAMKIRENEISDVEKLKSKIADKELEILISDYVKYAKLERDSIIEEQSKSDYKYLHFSPQIFYNGTKRVEIVHKLIDEYNLDFEAKEEFYEQTPKENVQRDLEAIDNYNKYNPFEVKLVSSDKGKRVYSITNISKDVLSDVKVLALSGNYLTEEVKVIDVIDSIKPNEDFEIKTIDNNDEIEVRLCGFEYVNGENELIWISIILNMLEEIV